jgi:peptidoglycan/LPS O-acetylase OafA/YrhL
MACFGVSERELCFEEERMSRQNNIDLIAPLTSLRFFAAMSIFVYHLSSVGLMDDAINSYFHLSEGVSFFFVLSGFVLQHTYRHTIGQIGAWSFVFLRFARIYPLHLVTLLLTLPFVFSGTGWRQLLANLTLTQSWVPDQSYFYGVNNVSWSLSDEMFFYLCFPALTGVARRNPMLLFALVIGAGFAFLKFFHKDDLETAHAIFGVSPISRIPEFIFGMLAYELRVRWTSINIGWTSIKLTRVAWTAVEICTVALMIFADWDLPFAPDHVWAWGGYSLTVWVYDAGCGPAFAVGILIFSLSRGFLAKLLEQRILVLLGEISFGLYLFHPLALRAALYIEMPKPVQIITGLGMAMAFAYAGWTLIEKPVMREAKRLVQRKVLSPFDGFTRTRLSVQLPTAAESADGKAH